MTSEEREQVKNEITMWILEEGYESEDACEVIYSMDWENAADALRSLCAPTEEAKILREAIRDAAKVRWIET